MAIHSEMVAAGSTHGARWCVDIFRLRFERSYWLRIIFQGGSLCSLYYL